MPSKPTYSLSKASKLTLVKVRLSSKDFGPILKGIIDFEMNFQQLLDGVRRKFLHCLMPIFSGKAIFSSFRCIFSNPSELFVLILFIGH